MDGNCHGDRRAAASKGGDSRGCAVGDREAASTFGSDIREAGSRAVGGDSLGGAVVVIKKIKV